MQKRKKSARTVYAIASVLGLVTLTTLLGLAYSALRPLEAVIAVDFEETLRRATEISATKTLSPMSINSERTSARLVFWRQHIFWQGARYWLSVERVSATETRVKIRGCRDHGSLPGCNIFREANKTALLKELESGRR